MFYDCGSAFSNTISALHLLACKYIESTGEIYYSLIIYFLLGRYPHPNFFCKGYPTAPSSSCDAFLAYHSSSLTSPPRKMHWAKSIITTGRPSCDVGTIKLSRRISLLSISLSDKAETTSNAEVAMDSLNNCGGSSSSFVPSTYSSRLPGTAASRDECEDGSTAKQV